MEKDEFKKIGIINEFNNFILQKNYSINTLISYIDDLYYLYLFLKKDLVNTTETDIRDYLEYLNLQNESASTVRRKISSFKTFFKFLYNNGSPPVKLITSTLNLSQISDNFSGETGFSKY